MPVRGLSGGANAINGGVVIALDWLDAITRIDPLERIAVVQPGVINDDLRATVAQQGLWYPLPLDRLGPMLTEDVWLPIAAVPEMLVRIEKVGIAHHLLIANIAHTGDGNLHPLLIVDPDDGAARKRAKRAFAEVLSDALELGGTVTGEQGIRLLKRRGLAQEVSPAVLAMHRAVKQALDPHHIMNPGKVFASVGLGSGPALAAWREAAELSARRCLPRP